MSATNDNITIIEMENKSGTEKQDSNEEQLKLRLPRNESNLVLFNQLTQCGDLHGIIQISELKKYVDDPYKSDEVIVVVNLISKR